MPRLIKTGKPKRKSRTIQGALAAAASLVALGLRAFLDLDVAAEELTEVVTATVALVGAVVALVGRIRATETVS